MTDTAKLIKVAELLGRRAAVTNPALRRLAKKARLRRPLDILIKRAAVAQGTVMMDRAARQQAARQQAARQQAARQRAAQQRAAQQRAAAPAAATAKAVAPAAAAANPAFWQGRFGKGLKTTGRVGGLLSLGTTLGAGGLGLYNWLTKPKQQAPGTKKWTPYEQSMFARMNINPEQYSQEFDALRDFFQGQQMKNMRQRYLNAQLQQMAM